MKERGPDALLRRIGTIVHNGEDSCDMNLIATYIVKSNSPCTMSLIM